MRRMESDALDGCPICGIPRRDADLDVYGRWCVDRDGCSRRWLERRKSSPHRLAFRPVGCVNSVSRTDLADLQGDRVYEPMRGPENAGTGIRLRQRGRNRRRCARKRRWSATVRQTVQVRVRRLP